MKITDEMVSKAIEAGEMIGWDFIEDRMRDALTAALPCLQPIDVAAVRRQAFEKIIRVIDVFERDFDQKWRDQLKSEIRALSAEPTLKRQQHDK